uniref:KIAA1958 n=1 Tax=Malurus cyaneus samueli TaxID=2593467 RepID=A0A8C5TS00_9PASS
MEDCLHTSSENLSKLVSWAHSHGTICSLIPNLKHLLSEGTHGNLTAMWGCSAGHAYHWPLAATCRAGSQERVCFQDSRSFNSDSPSMLGVPSEAQASPLERYPGRPGKAKLDCTRTRDSCDFSYCSEPSELGEPVEEYEDEATLFDMVCESSVTDEDSDFEPHPHRAPAGPRKRPAAAAQAQAQPDYYIVANAELTAAPGPDPTTALCAPSRPPRMATQRPPRGPLASPARGAGGGPVAALQVPATSSNATTTAGKPISIPLSALQLPGQEEPPAAEETLPSVPQLAPGGEVAGSPSVSTEPEVSSSQQQPHAVPTNTPEAAAQLMPASSSKGSVDNHNHSFNSLSAELSREQNEKTIRSTQTALRNFREFLISKYPSETREIYVIPCKELDAYLASFFVDARQKDGSEYEPNSLANYQCGLERYLKEHRYGYSITRDKEFKRSQEALKQKQIDKAGMSGDCSHNNVHFFPADEEEVWMTGCLGGDRPTVLLSTEVKCSSQYQNKQTLQEQAEVDIELLGNSENRSKKMCRTWTVLWLHLPRTQALPVVPSLQLQEHTRAPETTGAKSPLCLVAWQQIKSLGNVCFKEPRAGICSLRAVIPNLVKKAKLELSEDLIFGSFTKASRKFFPLSMIEQLRPLSALSIQHPKKSLNDDRNKLKQLSCFQTR